MTATYTPKRDEALFRLDGELLIPGVLSKGPWYEGTLHGSAMLAAVARAAEQHHSDVPRQVVRLTVDMMRAAPMTPLRVETSTVRSGKGIDFVDIAMYAGGEVYVRGTALRMRLTDLVVDEPGETDECPQAPDPDVRVTPAFDRPGADEPAFHHAIDIHADRATATVWFRLAVPVVEGETTTSSVTVATLADWTYAGPHLLRTAAGSEDERTVFAINADTTINTFRPMAGEWLGLRTTSHTGSLGAGTSGAQLFDELGPVGFTSQSVLVRGASGAPLSVKEVSA